MLSKVEVNLQAEPEHNRTYRNLMPPDRENRCRNGSVNRGLRGGADIYDMCKAVQKDMVIGPVRLLAKSGGKSGDFKVEADD